MSRIKGTLRSETSPTRLIDLKLEIDQSGNYGIDSRKDSVRPIFLLILLIHYQCLKQLVPIDFIKICLFCMYKFGRSIPTNLGHSPLQIDPECSRICHPDKQGFPTLVALRQLGHNRLIFGLKEIKFLMTLQVVEPTKLLTDRCDY